LLAVYMSHRQWTSQQRAFAPHQMT